MLGVLSLSLILGSVFGQNGKLATSVAKKAFAMYNLDPQNNKRKLGEAKENIDQAILSADVNNLARTWQLKGDVYNEIATQIVVAIQLGLETSEIPSVEDPAGEALEAFIKAHELAVKKYETKDALRGIQASQTNLSNTGVFAYDKQKYEQAYNNFNGVITAHTLLNSAGEASSLDDPQNYSDQLYITGLAALNANKHERAKPMFQELFDQGYDKPVIYESLYKIKLNEAGGGPESAYGYLKTGREKFPDDISLLFAEINHFLSINNLDELIKVLQTAIEKEPENISLYATLGNVYDNLFQREFGAGNEESSQQYFNNAKKYYGQALEKDPALFDAIYSIGTLYYNKAAFKTTELNALADDFSEEGMRKYDEQSREVLDLFDKAFPYFKKAESMQPNDLNTLIALKEICAKNGQMEAHNAIKIRLQNVQAGRSNSTSYFNQ